MSPILLLHFSEICVWGRCHSGYWNNVGLRAYSQCLHSVCMCVCSFHLMCRGGGHATLQGKSSLITQRFAGWAWYYPPSIVITLYKEKGKAQHQPQESVSMIQYLQYIKYFKTSTYFPLQRLYTFTHDKEEVFIFPFILKLCTIISCLSASLQQLEHPCLILFSWT